MSSSLSHDILSASSNLLCPEDAEDVVSWAHDSSTAAAEWVPLPLPAADRRPVSFLLDSEPIHMPRPDYLLSLSRDSAARRDAVNWILQVNEFYRFRPVTAYLSVSYLDRFLSSNALPGQNGERGWPMQLVSVACVSVAAKMEETHVPLLLDLQILGPRFVFEPRTVRRMELLLMAALRWRLRAVTPFDFLDHLAHCRALSSSLLSRAADLILRTRRVVELLGYRPSAIAAAAIACGAGDYSAGGDAGLFSCFDEWVSKEVVEGCRQLMEEYLLDTYPYSRLAKAFGEPPAPQSPVGVLDAAACGSCDTQKSSVPEPSPTEPPLKRRRLSEIWCTESLDTGGDDGKDS